MARIKHIAIYTQDPGKEADFYCRAFDLKQVNQSPSGAIYLSDGYINVALLKPRGAVKPGLHHFGFEVENVKQAQERLRRIKPDIEFVEPHPGVAFAEYKASDPDGNPFDISEKGWEV
jgi:catechol 2,3-dioxygenase-like lactoylglutathione lyase family enzyme